MPPRRKRRRQAQAPPPPPPPPPRVEIIDIDEETWDIRSADVDLFDPTLEYENKPGMFTVALHHGGAVVKDTYVGGSVTHFDNCSVEQFQLLDLTSMLLRLGYSRHYICEFYYCDPRYNDECTGTRVGRLVVPLIDECRIGEFLSFALSKERLMHVYVVEITAALARAKVRLDQRKVAEDFMKRKNNVVIEEIEDSEASLVKRKPRKKQRLNPKQLLIGWHERDIEFEEYLESSLAEARATWKKQEADKRSSKVVGKNLMADFDDEDGRHVDDNVGIHIHAEAMPSHVDACRSSGIEFVSDRDKKIQSSVIEGAHVGVENQTTAEFEPIIMPLPIVAEERETHGNGSQLGAVATDTANQGGIEGPSVGPTHGLPDCGDVEGVSVQASVHGNIETDKGNQDSSGGAKGSVDVDVHVEEQNHRRSDRGKEKVVDEESYRPTLEDIDEDDEDVEFEFDFEDFHFGALFEETFIPQHEGEGEPSIAAENVPSVHNIMGHIEVPVVNEGPGDDGDDPFKDNDCPLHNEGPVGDDDDEDIDHFISLASMCRDEQLFVSYYAEMTAQRQAAANEGPSSSGTKGPKRRQYSPVVQNNDGQGAEGSEHDLLHDLQDEGLRNIADPEEGKSRRKKGIIYTPFILTDECPVWNVGDVFGTKEYFMKAVRQYAVISKRPLYAARNDKTKMRIKCHGVGCQWFIYVRKTTAYNGIDYVLLNLRRYHAHTCSEVVDNKWITAKWLAERFTEKIKADPHISLRAIRQCVDEQFGSTLSRMKAYRARDQALEGIFGRTGDQYKKLFYYKEELVKTHPDSSVHIQYESERDQEGKGPRFQRFYCCLGPLKKGWKRLCRPIIFLDGAFLRGMYKGQLITSMGMDPNNGWWPIAWGVAETESYAQWKWFIEHLDNDLEVSANAPQFVFMSDQQKGLGMVLQKKFPQSEHRYCVQHIYNNFKKRFIGESMKEKIWEISTCTTVEEFEQRMEAMSVLSPHAHQYLLNVAPREKWVMAFYSPHVRCDTQVNNMCETFNSKTADPREKAIITMLEEIRTNQMERIQIRGQWIKNYNYPVPPLIKETLDKALAKASAWRSVWNGEHSYQVSGPPGQYVVNLCDKTCTCRLWQIRGIPCVHACACIVKNGHSLTDYVCQYFSRDTMVTLYKHVLYPISGMHNWPRTSDVGFELEPPRTKRQRGRPRKKRREGNQVQVHADGVESLTRTTVMRCSRCGLDGHNRRTCKNDPRIPTPQASQSAEEPRSQTNGQVNMPSTSSNPLTSNHPKRSRKKKAPVPTAVPQPRTRSSAQRCGRRKSKD